jgi:S-adenosylmethionine uptake transporter
VIKEQLAKTGLKLYFLAIGWFILSLLSSATNDVIAKYVSTRLSSYEIVFFRFFFSSITLIPFILYYGKITIKTNNMFIHFVRGVLLFLGITGWTYGLSISQISTATIVSFMIPVFVIILGKFCLQEKIIWQRWFVAIISCVGLIITINPSASDFSPQVLILVCSSIVFAFLDIINKKFVTEEPMIGMLFYSSIITCIISFPFAWSNWVEPTMNELLILVILGISANLILFLLLKAFALVDVTALSPYRYIELIISIIMGYIIFDDFPERASVYGSLVIIPSVLFMILSEKQNLEK